MVETDDLIRRLLAHGISDVQLEEDDDWPAWIETIKAAAERREVWQYIDPYTRDEDLPIPPEKPRYPKPEDFYDEAQLERSKPSPDEEITEDHLLTQELKKYYDAIVEYDMHFERFDQRYQSSSWSSTHLERALRNNGGQSKGRCPLGLEQDEAVHQRHLVE